MRSLSERACALALADIAPRRQVKCARLRDYPRGTGRSRSGAFLSAASKPGSGEASSHD